MFSWPEVKEFRGRTVLGNLRRFGATLFRRRVLAGSPPALEPRLIAFPKGSGQGIVALMFLSEFHFGNRRQLQ